MLVLGTTQEPATLDPVLAYRAGVQAIVRLLHPDLTVFDQEGKVVPRLAAQLPSVERSSSGASVQWKLRPGLTWSDGKPVTPRDVIFGHEVELQGEGKAVNHETALQIDRIEEIDESTFVAHWKTKYRGVSDPRVHSVVPAHAYGQTKQGRFPSSGPYLLSEWKEGIHIVLERNPHWPGPSAPIRRLVFRFFPGEEAFLTELQSGGLDAIGPASGLSHENALRIGEIMSTTHQVVTTRSGLFLQLTLQLSHPLLAKKTVRNVINRAINRRRMADLVYRGLARPAHGIFAPVHPAFRPSRSEHLDNDGVPLERWGEGGRPYVSFNVPMILGFASESEASARAAAYLESALEELGLNIRLRSSPLRTLLDRLRRGEGPPLAVFAYRTRPDWNGAGVLKTGGRLNFGGFSDSTVDELLQEAEQSTDRESWLARLHAIEDIVLRELPIVPLLFRDEVSVRPRRLEGWRPTGSTTPVTWNAEEWRWGPAPE